MNKFQRQRSKEIKRWMKNEEDRFTTYRQAKRYWNWWYHYHLFSPCESCFNDICEHKVKIPIVYCPHQVTCDMLLVRALRLLPQAMKQVDTSNLDFKKLT